MKYKRIGESTEVALRVLVEKIGLTDVDLASMELDKRGRALFCNSQWERSYEKVCCLAPYCCSSQADSYPAS